MHVHALHSVRQRQKSCTATHDDHMEATHDDHMEATHDGEHMEATHDGEHMEAQQLAMGLKDDSEDGGVRSCRVPRKVQVEARGV